jgi:hypothetical protein
VNGPYEEYESLRPSAYRKIHSIVPNQAPLSMHQTRHSIRNDSKSVGNRDCADLICTRVILGTLETIRSAVRYSPISLGARRHRLISIRYISLLPCHSRGCFPETHAVTSYDPTGPPSVPAQRTDAISVAWLTMSSGRTAASGRAFLLSSVVGDMKSFST